MPQPAGRASGGFIYALTIFLGAFLLFQIQPIIAKYILPLYGGSQTVWTVSLLFFQLFLLLGYLYAHLVSRLKSAARQAVVHGIMLAVSLLFLPIAPTAAAGAAAGGDPTWQILLLLSVTLGLPYTLLASTSPLLQAWYARSFPGSTPYRLYALSNLGSLAALVTYPFIVEPNLARSGQALQWSWGMGAFVAAALLAGLAVARAASRRGAGSGRPGKEPIGAGDSPPGAASRILWVLLPAAASVGLLATTNKVVQELVAIPFLWIVPLALYLVSFIITFERPRWYSRAFFLALLGASYAGVVYLQFERADPALFFSVATYCTALFAGCMICHGEAARLKPGPSRLTGFYLSLSAGGALGGLFVAIAAPAIFDDYLEFQFGMIAVPVLWLAVYLRERPNRPNWIVIAGSGAGIVALAFGLLQGRAEAKRFSIADDRNFYGTLTVAEYGRPGTPDHHRTMRHGRILHGLQYSGQERSPTAYFTAHSGAGLVLKNFPDPAGRKIGVVGLGVGTLAAWAGPADTVVFYEINPQVETLARRYFTYLEKCAGRVEMVIADGRLALEREPARRFDALIVDAFNNDSPPLHLLTHEAFRLYFKHLSPDGAIAVNITSKYINFIPVVSTLVESFNIPWTTVADFNSENDQLRTQSLWLIATRNPALLANEEILAASYRPDVDRSAPLWTDDFTSLFGIVQW